MNTLSKLAAKELLDIQGVAVYGQRDRTGVLSFNVRELNLHDVSMILDETSKMHKKVDNTALRQHYNLQTYKAR